MATEKRLIDANTLKKAILAEPWKDEPNIVRLAVDYINIIVDEQPTVDAVEVVRCVNCQSHEPCEVRNRVWCKTMGRYMKEDGFCSEGVKKDA